MKFNTILLIVALVAVGALASAQAPANQHGGGPQCTPEPISMIGLGIAGLGLLRARLKKTA